MAVTDLTNTTWYFNDHPQKISPNRYDLTFTSNGMSFTKIGNHYTTTYLYDLNYYYVDGGTLRAKYAYESTSDASQVGLGSWSNQNYRTITITGGTDATNPDLIAWLEASATQTIVLTATQVAQNFTSYTATESAIYVYTVSVDGGGTATTGGTAERLFYNSASAGTTAIFWAESGQTITVSRQYFGQLVKINGFLAKPKVDLLVQENGGTNNVAITYNGLANGLYLGVVTEYSHQSPSSLSYSFACTDASITTVAHSSPQWSRNAMAMIIPSTDSTISVTANSGSSNEPKWKYIFQLAYEVSVDVNPSSGGTVNGAGNHAVGSTAIITANPSGGYEFVNWTSGSSTYSNNPLSIRMLGDVTLTANFDLLYDVTLTYDSTLGSASYYYDGASIVLSATPNDRGQFVGWYINSSPISSANPYTYTPTGDVTIECRFETVYTITDSVVGNGAMSYTRGQDRNDVTLTVIPSTNWHFSKYVVNGVEYTTTPLTLHLTQDSIVVAHFEEDDRFHITTNTNFDYGSIYLSDNDVYDGTVVTMWARPFPDYNFVRWGDGVTANPRSITVTSNVTLVAIYQRVADTNGIYQYRCYVKDQMALTDPPKAFMVVDTFDIRTDYLTNATSSLTVYSMASDVNEGDILVLYDPKGTTLYQGVINSIEDLTIDCSQMQSFYKGTWIYNVSPQDFLEHEIAVLLQDYADGKLYRSSYVDSHVAQRLGGITIDYVGSTAVNLPTELDKDGNEEMNTYDMEEFIYELYQKYNIEFDFDINFSGANYVHIRVPSYSPVKVGNNMFAIQDMLPITEIEETNRLVIYAQNKTYRTTYVATKNGIVEAPSTSVNRFNITNTEVVFSDDPVEDLIANNLPQTMFNHKIEFTLVIKNFLYEFGEFNLGGELDIYYGNDYYNSVLTGYEISKASNQNIVSVHFICGLVRKKLTQLLTLGKV